MTGLGVAPADQTGALIMGARLIALVGLAGVPLSLIVLHRLLAMIDTVRAGDPFVARNAERLQAIATPGHCSNHLCFALLEENALFSGDHVMGWSTSIVAPPDGSMRAHMDSLDKMRGRPETIYWPGHGGPVVEPQRYLRALIHHRRQREVSILNALGDGPQTVPALVARIYVGLNPALTRAAGLSTLAHLEDLSERGMVVGEMPPGGEQHFRLA